MSLVYTLSPYEDPISRFLDSWSAYSEKIFINILQKLLNIIHTLKTWVNDSVVPKNLINLIQCPNSVNQEGVAIRMISIAKYHFYILENEIKGYSSHQNRKDFGFDKTSNFI